MLSSASQSFCEDRDLCYIAFPGEEAEYWKDEETLLEDTYLYQMVERDSKSKFSPSKVCTLRTILYCLVCAE